MSLPLRECGLKYIAAGLICVMETVTPFAGVWIEITQWAIKNLFGHVTPFAGVWIEIGSDFEKSIRAESHSLCGSVD